MKTVTMAFLYPTEGLSEDDKTLAEQLWAKTAELLKPNLGKLYTRFEPAGNAWGETIGKPFGVVPGRSDPRMFLLLYGNARERQGEAVKFHTSGFLGNLEIGESFEEDGRRGFTMNPKNGKGPDISMHLSWHIGMMAGQILPDAGIYYVPARQAAIGDALEQQILSGVGNYALSLVRFYGENGDV